MFLTFFDESKPDPGHNHYHIGAVCIHENYLATIEKQINDLSACVFGSDALSKQTEFHAVDLYHRKRQFKTITDLSRRINILQQLAIIASQPEVLKVDIIIDCDKYAGAQASGAVAFVFLCERVNTLMKSQNALGMLIGDRESDALAEKYSLSLSDYRTKGTPMQYGTDISHLVDSVHFTASHLSRFLQLADAYTWLRQFVCRNRKSADPTHQLVFSALKDSRISLFPKKYKHWPT